MLRADNTSVFDEVFRLRHRRLAKVSDFQFCCDVKVKMYPTVLFRGFEIKQDLVKDFKTISADFAPNYPMETFFGTLG